MSENTDQNTQLQPQWLISFFAQLGFNTPPLAASRHSSTEWAKLAAQNWNLSALWVWFLGASFANSVGQARNDDRYPVRLRRGRSFGLYGNIKLTVAPLLELFFIPILPLLIYQYPDYKLKPANLASTSVFQLHLLVSFTL